MTPIAPRGKSLENVEPVQVKEDEMHPSEMTATIFYL